MPESDKHNHVGDDSNSHFSAGINALTKGLHISFVILSCTIAFIIIWYFTFGGYFTVNPQENIIVEHFGKVGNLYKEGWHWTFPYPVSTITRIPISKQTITLATYWHNADVKAIKNEAPAGNNSLVPGKDGYLLTGDANIIHTEWELIYSITDPMKYFLKCLCPSDPVRPDEMLVNPETGKIIGTRGPRTLIQSLLEDEVIKITATQKVDSALYKKSFDYMDSVKRALEKSIEKWDIGVKVENVNLKSKTAPLNTVPAFQEVIEAEQQSATEKQNARAYAVTIEGEAESDASRIVADAKVYRTEIVANIEAEQIYFKKILVEYKKNPKTMLISLYSDTISKLLENVKEKYILPESADGSHEVRIMLNPEPRYQKNEKNQKE
jgi:membrane protease subunit HflK